jgi:hypothetical protein
VKEHCALGEKIILTTSLLFLSDPAGTEGLYVAASFVYLMTVVLVITAIQWNVGDLVMVYFYVLLATTVCSLSIKSASFERDKEVRALGLLQYVTVVILGATLGK